MEKINEMYYDAFLKAHFEVPGEMFSLAMKAKRRNGHCRLHSKQVRLILWSLLIAIPFSRNRYHLSVRPLAMDWVRELAKSGDTSALYECIRKDPDALRRFDDAEFIDTPLHIAAAEGHADFAMAVMYLRPSFGRKLNHDIASPMHLALSNGRRDLALRLLAVDKELVRVKGKDGYTPLHVVVLVGYLDLLAKFLIDCAECIEDVTIQNETALHIAAKYARLDSLRILARWLRRTHLYCETSKEHLLDKQDSNSNTALHIASLMYSEEMIKVLLECKVNQKVKNAHGRTALEVMLLDMQPEAQKRQKCLELLRGEGCLKILRGEGCLKILRGEGYLSFNVFPNPPDQPSDERIDFGKLPSHELLMTNITTSELILMQVIGKIGIMSVERINALLVVLALILTITYQAILNPPGGVWPAENLANTTTTSETRWGNSVMYNSSFIMFLALNLLAFLLTSLFTVCLLQIVTNSRGITILVELLLSILICCLDTAALVITPFDPSLIFNKLTPILFIPVLVLFELVKGLFRSIGKYVRFFHEM
ncbi:ankyrin repeat-containing protein NPR4-like [Durio zibethinus]|uniref:Ankyrin repeat-containing protein NPR4-like n=1 Tax=Durio zibethinus TaxID=66656 RepID=A0A6P5Z5U8_DURZI|nr:ankyrin repeat-containing protein NPR4-like [Durio zibethinus]